MPKAEWEQSRDRIINHMNEDHVENMVDMVHYFFKKKPDTVKLVELDSDGFHIQADQQSHYLAFDKTCNTSQEIAMEAVRLSKLARAELEKIGQ